VINSCSTTELEERKAACGRSFLLAGSTKAVPSDEDPKREAPQDVNQPPEPAPASPSPPTHEQSAYDFKLLFQRILDWCFGRRFGQFVFALVFIVGLGLWNWDKIRDLPGVSPIVSWTFQKSLPKADPKRFAVAIAHLENDKDRQHEVLIREALKDFEGVQVLGFDRTISPSGEGDESGHDKAREYLKESGAHVLIWGLVHHIGGESAPRIYWTTSRESKRSKEVYQPERFELPELFWDDLVEVLRLVVVTQSAEFLAQEGHFIADQLDPFIDKVRGLLESAGGWETHTRAQVRIILANSLSTFGDQAGRNEPLEEAVAAYRQALKEITRERVPLQWAMTQNNLGTALWRLGERESGTERLEEAVAAYREALKEYTRERVPLQWATTQNNLGNALRSLGTCQ